MEMLEKIIELDFKYLETFTNRKDRCWGNFFFNAKQPDYYDANHAHIHIQCHNPTAVIEETVDFYQSKSVTPRFYIYNVEEQGFLISELKQFGFKYEELICPVQLWDHNLQKRDSNENVTIEMVNAENAHEALKIESTIKELGGKEIREKAFFEEFNRPEYSHYLLRYKGQACSTACIFEHEGQARLESVATLEAYRGMGLIGELISYIQAQAALRGISHLWVFPITEAVEKVYRKNGFRTLDKINMGHAFLGGKSINQLREE